MTPSNSNNDIPNRERFAKSRIAKPPAASAGRADATRSGDRPHKAKNLLAERSALEADASAPRADASPSRSPGTPLNRGQEISNSAEPSSKTDNGKQSASDAQPSKANPPQRPSVGKIPSKPAAPSAGKPRAVASSVTDNEKKKKLFTKQVFTTGEAAEVCKVSQQTIIRCFDAGRLQGFRVPGSRFRRIPREDLIQFMKANDIPTDGFGTGKKRVLVVDDDPNIVDLWTDMLRTDSRLEVRSAQTGYDAGIVSSSFKPELMILDYMLPDINGNVVCETIRANDQLKEMKIIIVSGVVKQDEIDGLMSAGADEFIKKPIDLDQLMRRITSLLEL